MRKGDRTTGLISRLLTLTLVNHGLSGQGAIDEDSLTVPVRYATSFLVERLDHNLETLCIHSSTHGDRIGPGLQIFAPVGGRLAPKRLAHQNFFSSMLIAIQ